MLSKWVITPFKVTFFACPDPRVGHQPNPTFDGKIPGSDFQLTGLHPIFWSRLQEEQLKKSYGLVVLFWGWKTTQL